MKVDESYVGPLFSAYGLRTWDMWLTGGAMRLCRHSVVWTLRLSAWQYLGFPDDPPAAPEPTPRDLWLREQEVQSVTVRHKAVTYNEVFVQGADGAVRLFGILDRSRTDEIRRKLGRAWPGRYREDGFERAVAGEAV